MSMPSPARPSVDDKPRFAAVAATVALGVLGATISVAPAAARCFSDLARVDGPVDADVPDLLPPVALAELTRLAVQHSPLLCIHAGVVSGSDGFLALPGHSGLGKTTLVASLVRAGFNYVSDEALAIDRATGIVVPFPRPLALAANVWPLLGPGFGDPPPPGEERLIEPARLGRVELQTGHVSDIVLLHRRPGPVVLVPARRGDAVGELLRRSFNHFREPEASFRAVVGLVRRARVWRAGYEQAPALATQLARTLGTSHPTALETSSR